MMSIIENQCRPCRIKFLCVLFSLLYLMTEQQEWLNQVDIYNSGSGLECVMEYRRTAKA